jgi:hypothetical protein
VDGRYVQMKLKMQKIQVWPQQQEPLLGSPDN